MISPQLRSEFMAGPTIATPAECDRMLAEIEWLRGELAAMRQRADELTGKLELMRIRANAADARAADCADQLRVKDEALQRISDKSLRGYIDRHIAWSLGTFGDGMKTGGVCKHIEKELNEIRQAPNDLVEWIDVIILALDGAWRAGYTADEIISALFEKQSVNMAREWILAPDGEPTEHKRAASAGGG